MLYLPRTTLLASLGLAVVGVTAFAQEAIWVRGTVERVEQSKLFVKTKYGAPVRLVAGDSPQLIAAVKSSIAEVRLGMFVRAVEKPHSPDIRQIAELHIFPDFMQHADSLYHLDQASKNGVTSGSVEQLTTVADGHTLTVKDKQGEKKLLISDSTAIIAFVPGEMSELKPGTALSVIDAKRLPEGLLQANIIIYGRDGISPPL
jgi:hypothetical protein